MAPDSSHHHSDHAHGGHDGHGHHGSAEGFITKYLFSQDHKRIGVQFLLTSLTMFVLGGLLALGVRWQLAYPDADVPGGAMLYSMSGGRLSPDGTEVQSSSMVDRVPAPPSQWKPGFPLALNEDYESEDKSVSLPNETPVTFVDWARRNRISRYNWDYDSATARVKTQDGKEYTVPALSLSSTRIFHKFKDEFYTTMFTMHASVMIFLVIIPLLVGAFGNFVVPLQIGARDMAFPFLNMVTYWMVPPGALIMLYGTFLHGVGRNGPGAGWTSYPPLAVTDTSRDFAQQCWLIGLFILGMSSVLGAVNYVTTIVKMRAPGMGFFRMPLTSWAVFITSILVLFSTPVLAAALVLQWADHQLHTSFFLPKNLVFSDRPVPQVGGGQPLLWQHLFWFYSHPAVYIMILPAMGIASDILSTFARKPIFGYRPMVYAIAAIAGLGFIVWGHHMFQSGMNPALGTTFTLSTIMIALPSAIKTFNWLGTLWGGNIKFTTAMLNAIGFVSMFVIGGLSGIFMASTPVDIFIHDTYFIVAHIHYVLFGGSIFGAFAGIYYWFPKMFGRMMNETLGKIHFACSFVTFNMTFFAMHILGMGGMPRRYGFFGKYEFIGHFQGMNEFITISAILLGFSQLIFAFNFIHSIFKGAPAVRNPWEANTLEWQTPSPPGHGNFETTPVVYRGPYEYASPEVEADYWPQTHKPGSPATA